MYMIIRSAVVGMLTQDPINCLCTVLDCRVYSSHFIIAGRILGNVQWPEQRFGCSLASAVCTNRYGHPWEGEGYTFLNSFRTNVVNATTGSWKKGFDINSMRDCGVKSKSWTAWFFVLFCRENLLFQASI